MCTAHRGGAFAPPYRGHRGDPLMTRCHHRAPRGAYAGTRAAKTGE